MYFERPWLINWLILYKVCNFLISVGIAYTLLVSTILKFVYLVLTYAYQKKLGRSGRSLGT